VKSRETNYHQAACWNNTNWRAAASWVSERVSLFSLIAPDERQQVAVKKDFHKPCVYLS